MIRKFYTNVFPLKGKIYERFIDDNGLKQFTSVNYKPSLFEDEYLRSDGSMTPSGYETIDKRPAKKIDFKSIYQAKQWIKDNKGIDNHNIYGNVDFQYPYISDMYPDTINYDISKVDILFFDIEVTANNGFPNVDDPEDSVTSITAHLNGKYHVFGLEQYTPKSSNVDYTLCSSEQDLLFKFITFWSNAKPDIVTGWFIKLFDIPYLIGRCIKIGMKDEMKYLSPVKTIFEKYVHLNNKDNRCFDIYGISILDYYDLYKKFSPKKQESYKLGYIGYAELGLDKIQDDEIAGYNLYKTDYEKFIDYNIRDVEIVVELESKLKMIELVMFIAYHAKVNYQDVFSPVKTWDTIIFNYLKQHKIVIPHKDAKRKDAKYEGAYVKEPNCGRYNNILLYDFTSLYPRIICSLNIGPETKREYYDFGRGIQDELNGAISNIDVESVLEKTMDLDVLKKVGCGIGVNGTLYDNSFPGMLSILIKKLSSDRTEAQEKMFGYRIEDEFGYASEISYLDVKQQALKILLNSLYGGLGNQYFRFYDIDNAEAVTVTGQALIQWVERNINKFLNTYFNTTDFEYAFYCDTDSVFLTIPDIDVDKLKEFGNNIITPKIKELVAEASEYLNMYENFLSMGMEIIANTGIWTAKKRYMMNVVHKDGKDYDEARLKIMGIESVRTSTPEIVRKRIEECITIILRKEKADVEKFVLDFEKEFSSLPPEDIAFPTSINDIGKYKSDDLYYRLYEKGTPIHVRGSILYNNQLTEHGLTQWYNEIRDGDKIKFVYLMLPNGIGENVISFPSILPEEYDLHNYIDYKTQFQKTFLEPIERITDIINWRINGTPSLPF